MAVEVTVCAHAHTAFAAPQILRTATGPEIKELDNPLTYFGLVEGGKVCDASRYSCECMRCESAARLTAVVDRARQAAERRGIQHKGFTSVGHARRLHAA